MFTVWLRKPQITSLLSDKVKRSFPHGQQKQVQTMSRAVWEVLKVQEIPNMSIEIADESSLISLPSNIRLQQQREIHDVDVKSFLHEGFFFFWPAKYAHICKWGLIVSGNVQHFKKSAYLLKCSWASHWPSLSQKMEDKPVCTICSKLLLHVLIF